MEHKLWKGTVMLAIFCGLIHNIKAKPDPIVFKPIEDSKVMLNTNSKSLQQVKRNVDEGEQQGITKIIPVSSSSITMDATLSPVNEIALEVKPVEIPEKVEKEEKVEEKLAIPVMPIATPRKLLPLTQICDPSGETTSCSTENSSCMRMSRSSNIFICDCNENYEGTPNGDCVRSEGSPCSYRKEDCSQSSTYLSCIDYKCVCEKSDIYNPVTKKCDAKLGGTCFGEKTCIGNAYCSKLSYSDFSISPVGVCECKKGFVESGNSMCLRSYGRTCSRTDECDHLNLVCREGICHCSDSLQRYDFKSKSCRSVVGAECSVDEGEKSCVEGAHCKVTTRKLSGRCACMPHLIQSEYRTCVHPSAWYPVGG